MQLPQASIWGGISYNGESISITTTYSQGRAQLYLRKMGPNFNTLAGPIQLTRDSDPESSRHITDHKHLFLNGFHFVVFSVAGDSDLYILKTDRDGRRIGSITPVVEGTANRTNDMMLASDGDLLYVSYFKPNDQSVVHVFDQDLRQVRTPLETSRQLPHNNLGGLFYLEGRFFMFTGDKAGPNSNLILTLWNRDWTPAADQRRILLPAPAGGGYFFASGIAFDKIGRRWYLAFHHVSNTNPDATTHIDLAVLDESFRMLEHQHTDPGFRPHLLLRDTSLYMVYDMGGVFLRRYDIRGATVVAQRPATLLIPSARDDDGISTGLAIVNPSGNGASLELSAYSDEGRLLQWPPAVNPARLTLLRHAQRAGVVREFFGAPSFPGGWLKIVSDESSVRAFFLDFDSPGETMDGSPAMSQGYFAVSAASPLAGFAVFGTTNLSSLAAIPAQEISSGGFEGAGRDEDYLGVAPESDFEPPRGGLPGGPGPAMFRLMVARSTDGLRFERESRIVTDQGAVPDLVVDSAGTIYLYYTAWTVERQINKTVVAISKDRGATWTFRKLDLERREGESDLVDPDVLILPDGTFRLYVTIGGEPGAYPHTYYLDSQDGIHFQRRGVAFDPGSQALDPSAIRIGGTYHIFAGGAGDHQLNWHGTASDAAVYKYDRMMRFDINNFGQMMANGLAVEGGYRFYCFGNDRLGGISSFFSTDGVSWTADPGYRLSVAPESRLEAAPPTDPAVARLPDGSYLMVYSCPMRR